MAIKNQKRYPVRVVEHVREEGGDVEEEMRGKAYCR
jgi:hypothetical protein